MRILRPLAILSFIIVAYAVTTCAQQTSLQATLSRDSMGHARVTLTNPRSADARAYIVACDYAGPADETLSYLVVHEGLGGPPYTVWAGKSQIIGCPLNTSSVEVKAVAYDDGTTEGDSQTLAAMAAERQSEAQDVADDIEILQDALTKLGPAPSFIPGTASSIQVSQLAAEFSRRAQQHSNAAFGSVPNDYVCTPIARMLSSPVHRQPMTLLIQVYIKELQTFSAVLARPAQNSTPSSTK
jgi:hypothetical protein